MLDGHIILITKNFSSFALRTAKTPESFGHSECNMVKYSRMDKIIVFQPNTCMLAHCDPVPWYVPQTVRCRH